MGAGEHGGGWGWGGGHVDYMYSSLIMRKFVLSCMKYLIMSLWRSILNVHDNG